MQPTGQPPHSTRVFVSPHLDDAVLSCGALIARSHTAHIVTVFAGRPRTTPTEGAPLTEWDAECGFALGDDVVGMRRAEDAGACAALDAEPVWLDFVDRQYREPATVDDIAEALREQVSALAPVEVFVPLGLVHPDHERTHEAARRLVGSTRWDVYAYEDAPYRAHRPAVDARVAELAGAGFAARPVDIDGGGDDARKHEAIACYRSQVDALRRVWPGCDVVWREERYWSLDR